MNLENAEQAKVAHERLFRIKMDLMEVYCKFVNLTLAMEYTTEMEGFDRDIASAIAHAEVMLKNCYERIDTQS